jgi:hypothetical protein
MAVDKEKLIETYPIKYYMFVDDPSGIDGVKVGIPIIKFELNVAINQLPALSVQVPLGLNIETIAEGKEDKLVKTTDEYLDKLNDGTEAVFNCIVDDETFVMFEGVLNKQAPSVTTHNIGSKSTAYIALSFTGIDTYLSGDAIKNRVFIGKGKVDADYMIDPYRDDYLSGDDAADNIKRSINESYLKFDTIDEVCLAAGEEKLPSLILQVIKLMYNRENDIIEKGNVRELDKAAIERIEMLLDSVEGGQMKKSDLAAESRVGFYKSIVESLASIWGESNGFDSMVRILNAIFYQYAPQINIDPILRQDCPAIKYPDKILESNDILSVNGFTTYTAHSVTGIILNHPYSDVDKNSSDSVSAYIVYPTEGDPGLYKHVELANYAVWLAFYPKEAERKATKPSEIKKKGRKTIMKPKGVPTAEFKEKPTDNTPSENYRRYLYEKVGMAVYGMEKWRNNALTIGITWRNDLLVGDIIKFDLGKCAALSSHIPKKVYIGRIEGIQIAGAAGALTMSLAVRYVRTEADNDKFGLEEWPLYDNKERDEERESE